MRSAPVNQRVASAPTPMATPAMPAMTKPGPSARTAQPASRLVTPAAKGNMTQPLPRRSSARRLPKLESSAAMGCRLTREHRRQAVTPRDGEHGGDEQPGGGEPEDGFSAAAGDGALRFR